MSAYYFLNQQKVDAGFGYVEENLGFYFLIVRFFDNFVSYFAEAPHYHWYHDSFFHSFDHAAIRRGYQVFDTIAKPCHRYLASSYV